MSLFAGTFGAHFCRRQFQSELDTFRSSMQFCWVYKLNLDNIVKQVSSFLGKLIDVRCYDHVVTETANICNAKIVHKKIDCLALKTSCQLQ